MRIEFSRYQLNFKDNYGTVGKNNMREGALLRVVFEEIGHIGYCDCHPWAELGDLPLNDQLIKLKEKRITPLLANSLQFAKLDAMARKEGKSLFEHLEIPLSHQLIPLGGNLASYIRRGIHTFKVKAGSDPQVEIKTLSGWVDSHPNIRLRLDFNEKLNREAFMAYWSMMPEHLIRVIDFFEDPYTFDPYHWKEDQEKRNVSFAADHNSSEALKHQGSAHVIIHKPAVDPWLITGEQGQLPKGIRVVVTSYLDHPFGQMCAAYVAALLKKQYPDQVGICGLLSHDCYQKNNFIEAINQEGARLLPPEGTGIGFDEYLKGIPWQSL